MSHTQPHTSEAKEKMRIAKLGKHLSPATEFKKGQKNPYEEKRLANLARGERSPRWNPNPTYSGIHQWVYKTLGKPMTCTECGVTSDNPKKIHWANLSGQYKRDISDWKRLCARCHFKMDDIINRGWATRKANGI